jgi:hypothetical protein
MNIWPFSTIKKQRVEIEKLQDQLVDAMVGDIKITEFVAREEELGLKLEGSILHVFAAGFVHHFHAQGATNFLEVEFVDPKEPNERYTLTIQRLKGLRPAIKASLTTDAAIELMNAKNQEEAELAMEKLHELTSTTSIGGNS